MKNSVLRAAVAAMVLGIAAMASDAAVILSFAAANPDSPVTLSYDGSSITGDAVVDLETNIEGVKVDWTNVQFDLLANEVAPGLFDGSFSFSETILGDVVSVDFEDASLYTIASIIPVVLAGNDGTPATAVVDYIAGDLFQQKVRDLGVLGAQPDSIVALEGGTTDFRFTLTGGSGAQAWEAVSSLSGVSGLSVTPVPEPASVALVGLGMLAMLRRKR